jgi:hypothetical protein
MKPELFGEVTFYTVRRETQSENAPRGNYQRENSSGPKIIRQAPELNGVVMRLAVEMPQKRCKLPCNGASKIF